MMQITQRTPPVNYEAEQAVLGAILMDNRAYDRVGDLLQPDHFADPAHAKIFESCRRMIEGGRRADPVTLSDSFTDDADLAAIGGVKYLAQLVSAVVSVATVSDYGRVIFDLSMKRGLIALGETLVDACYAHDTEGRTGEDLLESHEAALFSLSSTATTDSRETPFAMASRRAVEMAEAAHKGQQAPGLPTGLVDLDALIGGLHPSDLIILAGRPSMGKTALATNIAFRAAKTYRGGRDDSGRRQTLDGAAVAFFSLEMSAEQLCARILAEEAECAGHRVRHGALSDQEFERYVLAQQRLEGAALYIDATPALTISSLRTRARRMKRKHGIGLIIVDYLQLMRGAGSGRGEQNRVQEVSDITRGLKALAKELDVPVIALSQLSRAVEQREDKRPQLSDLRDSGSIEQDADVVMFVYREQYYLERAEPGRRPEESDEKFNDRYGDWQRRCQEVWGIAEAIVAKQRHGPIGTVRLSFQGDFTKFGNLEGGFHD